MMARLINAKKITKTKNLNARNLITPIFLTPQNMLMIIFLVIEI